MAKHGLGAGAQASKAGKHLGHRLRCPSRCLCQLAKGTRETEAVWRGGRSGGRGYHCCFAPSAFSKGRRGKWSRKQENRTSVHSKDKIHLETINLWKARDGTLPQGT